MPNLLFLTQRLPYPPVKGEKIRALEILRHFRKSFDVHLGCLIDDPEDRPYVADVRALCTDVYAAEIDRRRAKLACLRGLLDGQPLSVKFFQHRGLDGWVDGVLERVRPEVIFVFSSNMAPYVLDRRPAGTRLVVDIVDVDSEKWRAYADTSGPLTSWVYAREARLIRALEARIAREADYATFVSDAEAALFRNLVPGYDRKIVAVSNGVDLAYNDPAIALSAPFDTARPSYVFVGAMDYPPNVDAVRWFAGEILPLVRRRLPTARFYIVGSNPTPAVQSLAKIDGVHVTGRVADVRPYMKFASAVVAPMRIARGIQNKVLQPMAMGLVTIVTPDALEGIEAEGGREVLLAADAQGLADACLRAAETDLKPTIGAAAHRRMVERYGWAARLAGFDPLLGLAPADASPRRAGMAP